jgi:hypothetical protein
MMFRKCEANTRPPQVERLKFGNIRVNRNIAETTRDGQTVYEYETAVVPEAVYAAYAGAQEVALKREQEIADETILALIEEGSL